MTEQLKLLALASAIFLVSAGLAFAGDIEVGGTVTNIAIVKNAANLAKGIGSTAKQSIGTLSGNVRIGGDVRNVVIIGETVNKAKSIGTEAEIYAGALRDINTPGSVKQTIVVRSITNVASGFGTSSCVSLGHGKHC